MSDPDEIADGIRALERTIRRAVDAGEGERAAAAGVVLGVILDRSGTGRGRILRAMRTLDLAADLERPLAIRDAWHAPDQR